MNRLTKRVADGVLLDDKYDFKIGFGDHWKMETILERIAAYEDTGLEPEEVNKYFDGYVKEINRLREVISHFEVLKHQERLIELPCKIDSIVYAIKDGEIKVVRCDYTDGYGFVEVNGYTDDIDWELQIDFSDFGKTVFLTREEAEKALGAANV